MGSGRGAGRNTGRTCLGLDHADGDENIENAEAADNAAKRGMKEKQADGQRRVAQEVVLLPEIRPWEIQEKRTHLQTKNDQDYAQRFVHERELARPGKKRLTSGFLKRSDAVRHIAVVNIGRIDLRETLERRF